MAHYVESCEAPNTVIEWLMAECSTIVTRHCEATAMYVVHTYVHTHVLYIQYVRVTCDQVFTLLLLPVTTSSYMPLNAM